MSEYDSNYDSGGGILMSNNDTAYGYHNANMTNIGTSGSKSSNSGSKTSFFQNSNQSKYDDLKQMLESSKELLKLEAMKRIITMVAKGRSADSARELFPHVVKNVVTKNTELKKLVYLYLTRYAEQEQELALLSVATFQHALKDPNPFIRGSAIRVLSSIRVLMISPVVLIAIKDCANDMSPYVRKTAAHAIPKLVSLDPEIKNEVIDIIAKLLADKVSLVLGSAVAAFEEVCPDRFDLIHQNYRKLCQLLVDVDEWGQILIINMLVRYARTQFVNPNQSSNNSSTKIDPDHMLLIRSAKPLLQSRNSGVVLAVIQLYLSVAPHFEISASLVRPLIRLLHSHYEIQLIVLKNIATLTSAEFNDKWLEENHLNQTTKFISNGNEDTVDKNINHDDRNDNDSDPDEELVSGLPTLTRTIKSLFEPYLKSFFVKANDSTAVKILKLEILTNLSNTGNYISLILREFQAYILNYQDDLEFMSATIESIGQCASRIKEIAPVCLNGLVSLLSNRNKTIVAQSIVVIRTQIINKDDSIISMIIKQIVKLMNKISTAQARATIVWIVSEFCARNDQARKLAPNVLLQIAKTFIQEQDLVKLQALNLAAKLFITMIEGPELSNIEADKERLKLLINYIFNLAKYDLNYDVRDRGRFLKHLISNPTLARQILLAPKQVPNVLQRNTSQRQQTASSKNASHHNIEVNLASSIDSSRYRIGTLSHFIGKKLSDYEELPDYTKIAPDPSVRKQPEPPAKTSISDDKYRLRTRNGFLSDSDEYDEENESEEEIDGEEFDNDEEIDEDENEEDDDNDEDEDDEDEDDEDEEDEDEDEEEDEDGDEDDNDKEEVDENKEKNAEIVVVDEERKKEKKVFNKKGYSQVKSNKLAKKCTESQPSTSNIDLLLDLSDMNLSESSNNSLTTLHQPLFPMLSISSNQSIDEPYRTLESAEFVTYREFPLMNVPYEFNIKYRFPRINDGQRTLVELVIKAESTGVECLNSPKLTIQAPMNGAVLFKNIECQDNVATLAPLNTGETRLITLSIDFNESPSLGIELQFNRQNSVKLIAPLGDILYPVRFRSVEDFRNEKSKLTGMNQVTNTINIENYCQEKVNNPKRLKENLNQILLNIANVCTNQHFNTESETTDTNIFYYSACTVKFRSLILITVKAECSDSSDKVLIIETMVNCEKMVLGSMMNKLIKDECLKQLTK